MCQTGVAAARAAGEMALKMSGCAQRSVKRGTELVTQADPLCQQLIIDTVTGQYPEHGFLCEEGPDGNLLKIAPQSQGLPWWIIDPIDGTNNYANGLPCFSVSIGVMLDGEPVVGIVFDPVADAMYTAVKNRPAQLNGDELSAGQDTLDPFSSFGIDSHRNPIVDNGTREMMLQTRFRCFGSTALHMAYVAKGAMIGMAAATPKLWDICAGYLLVRQAGGNVTKPDGTALFPAQPETYLGEQMPVLAASGPLFSEILKIFTKK